MRASDQMLARLGAEIEQQQTFQDKLIEDAEKDGRDLTDNEMELFNRSRTRLQELNKQIEPVKESRQISIESRSMIADIARFTQDENQQRPQEVEYRSAGAYVLDYWKGSLGASDAMKRMDMYNRAASHQTTADNPGLLPTPIVQPVVNFIDESRPITTWLGPRQIPSNSWTRPKVTQHTSVAAQPTGEKNELVSQKMTITKTAVTANTYGGYVNVSRQDIDWSTPSIMDLVITDLAAQYGIVTETALGTALVAAATAGTTIPTGAPTTAALTGALWAAAATAYTAVKGQGRLAFFVSPDMLGLWGQLFAPVNPVTAQSAGFEAANFGSGLMGAISGIPTYMDASLAAGTNLVISSAAVEVYEDRIGSLQVVEPSVLGVQVAYAGYFTWWIADAGGVVKIVKTP
jgi:HK97 family phage major capsid protein